VAYHQAKVVKRICHALSVCASLADAARYGGIGPTTFHRWENRATAAFKAAGLDPDEMIDAEEDWAPMVEQKEVPFCKFWVATRRARANGHVELLETIKEHAAEDWKAGAKMLAIRDPDNYAERRRHEHVMGSGSDAAPVKIVLEVAQPLELEASGEHPVAVSEEEP